MASKWDKHTISEVELRTVFKDMRIYPISVLDGSARRVTQEIVNNFIKKKKEGEE